MPVGEPTDYTIILAIVLSLGAALSAVGVYKADSTKKPAAIGLTVMFVLAALFVFTR